VQGLQKELSAAFPWIERVIVVRPELEEREKRA
jgi:hypothetical protein